MKFDFDFSGPLCDYNFSNTFYLYENQQLLPCEKFPGRQLTKIQTINLPFPLRHPDQITSKLTQKLNCLEFLANVNTNSQKTKPFFSQSLIIKNQTVSTESHYLIVRASQSVAVLTVEKSTVSLNGTLNAEEHINFENQITAFECPYEEISDLKERQILIGTSKGFVYLYEFITGALLGIYGVANKQRVFRKSTVFKITVVPGAKYFFVLYSDNSIVQYSLDQKSTEIGVNMFSMQLLELEKTISFTKNWQNFNQNLNGANNKTEKGTSELQFSALKSPGFNMYQVTNADPKDKIRQFLQFDSASITDFLIVKNSMGQKFQFIKKFVPPPQFEEKQEKDHVIAIEGDDSENDNANNEDLFIFYSSSDGFLQIIELKNMAPIFSFRVEVGGINALCIKDQFLSLACQDDSVLIFSFDSLQIVQIIGQTSFISQAEFMEIEKNAFRIISSSYDGSIAFTQFEKQILLDEPQFDWEKSTLPGKSTFPIILKFVKTDIVQTLSAQNIQPLNNHGIGFLNFKDIYLASSSFDGCVSVFKFLDQLPREQEPPPSNSRK